MDYFFSRLHVITPSSHKVYLREPTLFLYYFVCFSVFKKWWISNSFNWLNEQQKKTKHTNIMMHQQSAPLLVNWLIITYYWLIFYRLFINSSRTCAERRKTGARKICGVSCPLLKVIGLDKNFLCNQLKHHGEYW